MHNRPALILGILIMAVAGYAAFSAIAWPLKTALFPLVISIPLFVLAAAEVACVVLEGARVSLPGDSPARPAEAASRAAARSRALVATGWIVGFFVLILLFGFLVAVPLFVFLYLKLQSREGWVLSIVFTAIVWAAFYGLFDYTLHLPFGSGLLW